MAGLHVIVKNTPEGRVRLKGVFTDEEFFALPLVKSFGAFPSRYHALHFTDDRNSVGYGMVMTGIPEHPTERAVDTLAYLERWAKRARYKLVYYGGEEFFASASKADRRARALVADWRRLSHFANNPRHTAVQTISMPLHPQDADPGRILVEWQLKRRHSWRQNIIVTRIDARGALAFADSFNQMEIDKSQVDIEEEA